jgi:hypothetical protein
MNALFVVRCKALDRDVQLVETRRQRQEAELPFLVSPELREAAEQRGGADPHVRTGNDAALIVLDRADQGAGQLLGGSAPRHQDERGDNQRQHDLADSSSSPGVHGTRPPVRRGWVRITVLPGVVRFIPVPDAAATVSGRLLRLAKSRPRDAGLVSRRNCGAGRPGGWRRIRSVRPGRRGSIARAAASIPGSPSGHPESLWSRGARYTIFIARSARRRAVRARRARFAILQRVFWVESSTGGWSAFARFPPSRFAAWARRAASAR